MFCLGRRKSLMLLTFLVLFLLVMTVTHYLSPPVINKDDFLGGDNKPEAEEQPGNSWRLVSHELDEEDEGFPLEKDDLQQTTKPIAKISFKKVQVQPQAAPPPKNSPVLSLENSRYIPEHRVVHLDLKGAPPKMSYLKNIFPLLKEAGATALLIEYEDMFPYFGPLRNISAKNAFSTQDIQTMLTWASQNDLIVIPLIQTFGHLEFVLKLEEFRHLRESAPYPQSLCPSRDQSWKLVTQMIDQVLSLHPDSEWLHIGCDEVYQLAQCSVCAERMAKTKKESSEGSGSTGNGISEGKIIFLEHIHRVGQYVREQKKIIPIIWDDMLRSIPVNVILNSGIGSLVEPMIWVYVEDVDRFVDSVTWASYSQVFEHVWSASAFKGAFGERMFSVNIQRHAANQLSWLEVMRRESTKKTNRLSFRGIVLTGWSRYDHFAVLCELLPAALPSLILNLAIVTQGGQDFESVRRTHRILQCSTRNALLTPDELRRNPFQWDLHRCRFPGSTFFGLLSTYRMTLREVDMASDRIHDHEGWMTQYNVDHKFSSPYRVQEMMRPLAYLPGNLRSLENQVEKALSSFFDEYTVAEWVEQHIKPMIRTIDDLHNRATILTSVSSWPQRPLGYHNVVGKSDAVKKAHKSSDRRSSDNLTSG